MPHTRRKFLKNLAALAATGIAPTRLLSQMEMGPGTLRTVSDGHLVLPGSFIFETMPSDQLPGILDEFGLSQDRLEPECNLTLYQDGTNTVLFDVGSGPDFMPTAGALVGSLDALGLSPEDITHVVFTHAHPDHIWGLLDDFDDPLFADANYLMGTTEWDYWWNPETVNSIGEDRAAFAVGAKRRMEVIQDQVTLFEDGQEILPGIAAVASHGHTPGHMSFEIRNGTTSAIVLGDAIGNHHVAFKKPEWPSGSDQNAQEAIASRKMLFDRITNEDMAVVGFHLPQGGLGRVDRHEDGFVYVPEGS